jgi:Fe-S-cluster-containing dehydrogenase component
MELTRREALHKIATGTATAVAVGSVAVGLPGQAEASGLKHAPPQALGLLYDSTKCIGCQSCVVACAEVNKVSPDTAMSPVHYVNQDLSSFTKNIIKLYKSPDNSIYSYVKQQCMHCVDPACVAGCMFKGLKKDAVTGVVTWNGDLCVGCRYCEIACPYHVPKFQWIGFNPKIVKCELCNDRVSAGQQPGCTSVCPTHAVVFGKREDLLKEAKSRVKTHPGKYADDKVFGEADGGGTQVLMLSHVNYDKLGMPRLGDESVPEKYLKWQKRLYSYLVFPVFLYGSIVAVVRKNWKHHEHEMAEEEKKTGLRAQL